MLTWLSVKVKVVVVWSLPFVFFCFILSHSVSYSVLICVLRAVVESVHKLDVITSAKVSHREVFKPENISLRNKYAVPTQTCAQHCCFRSSPDFLVSHMFLNPFSSDLFNCVLHSSSAQLLGSCNISHITDSDHLQFQSLQLLYCGHLHNYHFLKTVFMDICLVRTFPESSCQVIP